MLHHALLRFAREWSIQLYLHEVVAEAERAFSRLCPGKPFWPPPGVGQKDEDDDQAEMLRAVASTVDDDPALLGIEKDVSGSHADTSTMSSADLSTADGTRAGGGDVLHEDRDNVHGDDGGEAVQSIR